MFFALIAIAQREDELIIFFTSHEEIMTNLKRPFSKTGALLYSQLCIPATYLTDFQYKEEEKEEEEEEEGFSAISLQWLSPFRAADCLACDGTFPFMSLLAAQRLPRNCCFCRLPWVILH